MTEPGTAAGRDFVSTMRLWFMDGDGVFDEEAIAHWTSAIIAIESEAAEQERERIRVTVDQIFHEDGKLYAEEIRDLLDEPEQP